MCPIQAVFIGNKSIEWDPAISAPSTPSTPDTIEEAEYPPSLSDRESPVPTTEPQLREAFIAHLRKELREVQHDASYSKTGAADEKRTISAFMALMLDPTSRPRQLSLEDIPAPASSGRRFARCGRSQAKTLFPRGGRRPTFSRSPRASAPCGIASCSAYARSSTRTRHSAPPDCIYRWCG